MGEVPDFQTRLYNGVFTTLHGWICWVHNMDILLASGAWKRAIPLPYLRAKPLLPARRHAPRDSVLHRMGRNIDDVHKWPSMLVSRCYDMLSKGI